MEITADRLAMSAIYRLAVLTCQRGAYVDVLINGMQTLYFLERIAVADGYSELAAKCVVLRLGIQTQIRDELQTKYRTQKDENGEWMVVDEEEVVIQVDPIDDEASAATKARDIAWAMNYGAEDDEEIVNLLMVRDGKAPDWA